MASAPPALAPPSIPRLTLDGTGALGVACDVVVIGAHSAPPSPGAAGGDRRARRAAPPSGAPPVEADSAPPVPAAGSGVVVEAFAGVSAGGLPGALAAVGATGRAGELTWLPVPAGRLDARAVVVAGLGPQTPLAGDGPDPTRPAGTVATGRPEVLRRAAGAAAAACTGRGRVVFALPAQDLAELEAVAEGAVLGAYRFDAYRTTGRTGPRPRPGLAEAVVVSPLADDREQGDAAAAAGTRAAVAGAAVWRVRDWINTPALDLYPEEFVARARSWLGELSGAAAKAVTVEVLDEDALRSGGYGGLLGVGRGSERPPRLLRIAYRPRRARGHLAFVGKGITFDTGGYSMKPPAGMVTMKSDMSGAATVVGAVRAAAELGIRTDITVYACLAENMVSARALHPSDVITIRGGTTVQVDNTDAEGRLVLADGLVRAGEDRPDVIVDVATLTGSCVVALGLRTAGVMGDAALGERIVALGTEVGEDFWPLPIPAEMIGGLAKGVADIDNVGDREGGALQAAAFLREFVDDGIAWSHLDVAGPAYNDKAAYGHTPKGGTGFGVRTLLALADLAAAEALELPGR